MKKRSVICLLLAVLLATVPINLNAFAQDDYSTIFANFFASDGAYAEYQSELVAQSFADNPEAFLKALSMYPESDIVIIAQALIFANYYDMDGFSARLEKLSVQQKSSSSVEKTISLIEQELVESNKRHDSSQYNLSDYNPRFYGFNEKVMRGFIDGNESNYDVEYFELIGKAFCLDSQLMAHITSDLPDEKIQYLAKGISYYMAKTSDASILENEVDLGLSKKENAVLDMLSSGINMNANTDLFNLPSDQTHRKNNLTTENLSIADIHYFGDELAVGKPNTLAFTLMEDLNTSVERRYLIEIYTKQDGVEYLKDRFEVIIPVGSNSIDVNTLINLYRPQTVETTIAVYNYETYSLITTGTSVAPQGVFASWYVLIYLGRRDNGDRSYPVWSLQSYGSDGTGGVWIPQVLGKSESGKSPLVTNGDTPTGTYSGKLDGPSTPSSSYGPYKVVNMTGVSGQIVDSNRTGIWIHGGDASTNTSSPSYPLRVTYGCVRLSNANQKVLVDWIAKRIAAGDNATGQIVIEESWE